MDNSPTSKGFTLVELIIVIIILGIVSTFAASRFVGTSSFSTFTAQEQTISVIRQIQVNRMQSNVSAANDSFRLAINSDCLGSVAACNLNLSNSAQKTQADARSDYVRESDISFSPANTIIDFDLLGNPSVSAGVNITINSTSSNNSAQVCINSQGYVREGACL
ncbi:prepilin-type N-terminal cleavage/methylation domain-containing protein [Vibrio sp. 10N.222.51.C8]|uniref:prepilin-type N-terminal cleavage/methylation domain-containing protein n=2 Tax=Vibrio TaxID=662 RepID=UPI000C853A2D|nr:MULTISPECIES: prepilin-type N-terminal cleavage/methylation domain-containing protein [unclassified Vibrio]PMK18033.1 MSHA biogenesis protein MshC [Vibrio sp. 10N.261.54.C3]PMN99293.1 MSHA biogenesis protein MshC [Vibrio sp. 10N.222.55.C12]PMO13764.1 MSHA biogenesis protein MshC [Vibrio sp. 10N.222.54.F10]PMO21572.1 MSHA biogenesis protein MshC [Vibrio sp. 10N.222.54.B6]TKF43851.1 prepilin-type N-terminal cleavage/methylation domain-containing protein [Vibrio sp. F13]